jgi:large subunit ribosomal protein L24
MAVAQQLRAVARFSPAELVFDEVAAEFAEGRVEGRLAFAGGATGVATQLRIAVLGAESSAIFNDSEQPPISGRMTMHAELAGSGRSPAALLGSLSGTGHIRLDSMQLAGLNPRVFETVARAAELGMPVEGRRLQAFVSGVLGSGTLQVGNAEAPINVAAGQARVPNLVLRGAGANLEITANLDLASATLDALLTLSGLSVPESAARPALLVALKGPLPAPQRAVETGLLASWLTLRAVEQQTQQIDAMEKARRDRPAPHPAVTPPPEPETTLSTPDGQLSGEQAPRQEPDHVQPVQPAPRAESAPPLAPSGPARTVIRPPGLIGAQN